MFGRREEELRLEALKLAVQYHTSGYASRAGVEETAASFYLFLNPVDPIAQ